ncbi:unnamed protein product [Lymnaea stagnalis]|uniref:Urease accessory protein D n=1 Tax=Lymnaea stagnalis TaxID=6523 RepID=A0AAV2I4G4_LYMST
MSYRAILPQRNPSCGEGSIEIEAVTRKRIDSTSERKGKKTFDHSEVVSMKHSYPFRFLVPHNSTPGPCKWIYPLTYGGGLVGGDKISATIKVGEGCAAVVCTQESTKVYHCNLSNETVQEMLYIVEDEGLLCILPDPTVCYRDANFSQKQIVHMKPTSSVVLLDWMLGGRVALDESWVFKRYCNSIEFYLSEELVIRECTELEDTPNKTVVEAMQGFQVYGTCIVLGENLSSLVDSLSDKYGRKKDIGEKTDQDLVVSISQTKYTVEGETTEGCYLRFLATNAKSAARVIHDITDPLLDILGADPFERKL